MQSVLVYGRQLARAFATGIYNEIQGPWNSPRNRGYHLVGASSGYSKLDSKPSEIIKKWSFGDDACFFAKHKLADVMGIADGVGGWRRFNIDPSIFSCTLMQICESLVKKGKFRPEEPAELLATSYAEILEDKLHVIGSCTACLVSLHKEDQVLYTANLGDSGFLVVRNGKVAHRSQEQQHYFNAPFQMSYAPPDIAQRGMINDSPELAETTSFPVEEGDIILLGTDGLFDNLTDDMIVDHLISNNTDCLDSIQTTANTLVDMAFVKSRDPDYISPFCVSAAKNLGLQFKGGKPDDIAVLLASVKTGELISSS